MYYINQNIEKLYRTLGDQDDRSGYLRLDWNENPIGLPKRFVDSLTVTPEEIAMYPETKPFMETLSKYLGVSEDCICLTNGSVEGIRHIIEAFTSEGGRVIGVSPSYPMYKVFCNMYNREWVDVKYKDNKVDVRDLLIKLTEDTQLLCLMNPNNPVGDVYSEEDFELILKMCKGLGITILIDEAYYLFNSNTFIKYALENDNVFVTRTFSKMFSMAGCRLGYIIGKANGIALLRKLCDPDNVNFFSLKVGKKLLESPYVIEYLIKEFKEGKEFLMRELKRYGYTFLDTNSNFLLIRPKNNAGNIVKRLKNEHKILVKCYSNIDDTGDYLRVTIGNKETMKIFLDALVTSDEIRVITYGTFDLFHYGHQRILERAKELGDTLIVAVTEKPYDDARGKTNVIQSLEERIDNIKQSGLADVIITEK